jgi:hypothetical protein
MAVWCVRTAVSANVNSVDTHGPDESPGLFRAGCGRLQRDSCLTRRSATAGYRVIVPAGAEPRLVVRGLGAVTRNARHGGDVNRPRGDLPAAARTIRALPNGRWRCYTGQQSTLGADSSIEKRIPRYQCTDRHPVDRSKGTGRRTSPVSPPRLSCRTQPDPQSEKTCPDMRRRASFARRQFLWSQSTHGVPPGS